jgi:hypothetical protein
MQLRLWAWSHLHGRSCGRRLARSRITAALHRPLLPTAPRFNAGVRCANYKAECPAGAKVAPKPANATAAPAAAAAKPANATAAAKPAAPAAAAAKPAATKTNSAAGNAVSAVLAVAGAAAILAM